MKKNSQRGSLDLSEAYREWASQPCKLTVPLKIVSFRGSLPAAWLKEFSLSQCKRARVSLETKPSLEALATLLIHPEEKTKGKGKNKGVGATIAAADVVSIGDRWLQPLIQAGALSPLTDNETAKGIVDNMGGAAWKKLLWHGGKGSSSGGKGDGRSGADLFAVPYKAGCTVVAMRKDKLEAAGIPRLQDWSDLLRPELRDRIAMFSSPRDLAAITLKSLGASANVADFDSPEVPGGREAVKGRWMQLQKQVRCFSDDSYLKALSNGDVWVAVGWSSEVLGFAKRRNNVAVIAPTSGTVLWADLWAVPSTEKLREAAPPSFDSSRIHGPSPLLGPWLTFCSQPARAQSLQTETFVGSAPSLALSRNSDGHRAAVSNSSKKVGSSLPPLDSNLINGAPPPEIMEKSEFLEPLGPGALEQHKWLLSQRYDKKTDPLQGLGAWKRQFLSGDFLVQAAQLAKYVNGKWESCVSRKLQQSGI